MKHFLLITCLLNALGCLAQTYTVKRLGLEKGLSNNYVIDIAEDKNGYLWFATEEGLNKLEGSTFTAFYKTENDEQGITGNELNCLLDDPAKPILWIGTQRAGLNAFNYETHTFTIYRHDKDNPNSLATDDVTGIFPAKDGNLWITTYWKGIDHLDKETGKFTHYNRETIPQLPSNHIWTALEDGKGNLYIGHRYAGLSILSLKTKQVENFRHEDGHPQSLPGNEVNCIYQDRAGSIWIGTDKGLALFNPEEKQFLSFGTPGSPLSNHIFDICQLNDKQLWVATEFGGIAIIDLAQHLFASPENIKYHCIREGDNEYSLSNSSVRCIFQDSFNNIWAGLWGGGINFLNNDVTLFNAYCYSKEIPGSNLNARIASAVCIDREGKLWVGTDGGGINVLENGQRIATYTSRNGSISGNSIQTAYCDTQGNLWFGLFRKGIMYYDSRQKTFRRFFSPQLDDTDVRSIFEDKQGLMWIGSSEGIYQIDRDSKTIIRHIDTPEKLVRKVITDIQGKVWVGTFGGGLYLYSPDLQQLHTFDTYAGFPSNTVNDIYEDRKQNIWIATGDGLVCFPKGNDKNYQVYQRTNGLDNTHIRAITEDNEGNIWFSTNKGITCFKTDMAKFYNYNHKDNIPLASFTAGCVCKDNKGELYFGSTNGLCYFTPTQVLAPKKAPQAFFMKITVHTPLTHQEYKGQTYQLTNCNSIKLNHKENNFRISFSIPNHALEEQVEYAYMLKGLNDSWYISEWNDVTFRDVPYGNYKLMVKTRIRNQEWSDEITTLSIHITPPFWLSWIAKLIYTLAGLALLFILLKRYKRRINLEYLYESEKWNHEQEQHLNDERLRFFTNITHELRTPLTLIIGPLEDMMGSKTLNNKDKHRIAVIYQSAIRLLELVNQILEFRKTETQNKKLCVCRENISALVYEIGLKYKELNKNSLINIQIQTEAEDMTLYFDKEAITIILDNLISNALKYTEKGLITISSRWAEVQNVRYLELSVQDTGYGISPDALPHIFDRYYQEGSTHQASGTGIGLALVKNLVTLHEGTITVQSKLNEGTTFVVRLIASNNYPSALHRDLTKEEEDKSKEKLLLDGKEQNTDNMRPVILIIEDNKDILDYMVESFTDLYEVKTASNGKEGQEMALAYIPDIIVSDVMMPVMDGITLCKRLKSDVRTSHIPIILLTAKDTLADKEEGYQSGADSYLTKPFSASLLHSRINNLLAQRRRLSERYIAKLNPDTSKKDLEEKHSILTNSLNKIDNEFLDKLTSVITENLSSTETIDISFLANHLCMSNSTLYRKVKALTGMSTNEFIRKIKMQLAEKMLLEGKYSIAEIAFKVGINSTVYFRQCFKEEFGMLPSEYLKKIKKGSEGS